MANESILITDAAAEYISNILNKNSDKIFLVEVQGSGCAGFEYKYELVTEDDLSPLDELIERPWGTVALDFRSVMYLLGSTLDLNDSNFSTSLVWNNPQATSTCGCGKSFDVKKACAQ